MTHRGRRVREMTKNGRKRERERKEREGERQTVQRDCQQSMKHQRGRERGGGVCPYLDRNTFVYSLLIKTAQQVQNTLFSSELSPIFKEYIQKE